MKNNRKYQDSCRGGRTDGGLVPEQTGRLTVGHKITFTMKSLVNVITNEKLCVVTKNAKV
jgi:hypothetical protein